MKSDSGRPDRLAIQRVLFLAAFLREPFLGGLARPFSRPAISAALWGMGLHWVASLRR